MSISSMDRHGQALSSLLEAWVERLGGCGLVVGGLAVGTKHTYLLGCLGTDQLASSGQSMCLCKAMCQENLFQFTSSLCYRHTDSQPALEPIPRPRPLLGKDLVSRAVWKASSILHPEVPGLQIDKAILIANTFIPEVWKPTLYHFFPNTPVFYYKTNSHGNVNLPSLSMWILK